MIYLFISLYNLSDRAERDCLIVTKSAVVELVNYFCMHKTDAGVNLEVNVAIDCKLRFEGKCCTTADY